jgi:hypothetical protein
MGYSIKIVDQYKYHGSIVFGLDIQAPTNEFPLLVGCSLLTPQGEEIDLPAKWLNSPGLVLWKIKADERFQNPREPTPRNAATPWYGKIIFALWRNDKFTERLFDTGWVEWTALWLIGSSTAGLNMQDEQIKRKYGHRLDVWSARKKEEKPDNDPLGIR